MMPSRWESQDLIDELTNAAEDAGAGTVLHDLLSRAALRLDALEMEAWELSMGEDL